MSQPLCKCGCGQTVRIAPVTDRSKGWVKGQPLQYLKGHSIRKAARIKSDRAIGNKTISTHGYVIVRLGANQRRYEHDLVVERAIGRRLKKFGHGNPRNEVVHHIDGDKQNNSQENLLVCTHEYHVALHHRLENSGAWPEFQKVIRRGFGGQS